MLPQDYENYQENKKHTDPVFPYNTYLCSIPLDFDSVPLHWHPEMELIYIKKGRGRVSIDLKEYEVLAGDICPVAPGTLHAIYGLENEKMEYENILFQLDLFSTDEISREYLGPLQEGLLELPGVFRPGEECYKELSACLDQADLLCDQRPTAYQMGVKAQLMEFFYLLASANLLTPRKTDSGRMEKVRTLLTFVESNYRDPISVGDAAALLGISESHFMRFFKQTFGLSFVDYLNNYRLSMAGRMLLSSDQTVLSIAQACGYDNLSYFNRVFKRRYGKTPREYRKG